MATQTIYVAEKKTRIITLTDARPVKIVEADWPVVAVAKTFGDGHIEVQANWTKAIRVREHSDGRRIVYGTHDRGPGGMHMGFRGAAGGSIVPPIGGKPDDEATIRAIRSVADEVIDDVQLGDECIADLPAEEI